MLRNISDRQCDMPEKTKAQLDAVFAIIEDGGFSGTEAIHWCDAQPLRPKGIATDRTDGFVAEEVGLAVDPQERRSMSFVYKPSFAARGRAAAARAFRRSDSRRSRQRPRPVEIDLVRGVHDAIAVIRDDCYRVFLTLVIHSQNHKVQAHGGTPARPRCGRWRLLPHVRRDEDARSCSVARDIEEMPIRTLKAPRCHLGEGPNYVPKSNSAWWVDILERRLFRAELDGVRVDEYPLPFMASAIATIDEAHHLLAADDGLYVRRMSDGHLVRHCALEADDARTRSNDGRVHPSGALWIGTMGREAEPGLGSIYHVLGGAVTRLYTGLTIPNGICFSPDGRTAYFVDTDEGVFKRVPVDPRTGHPIGEPSIFYDHRGGTGGLDGAAVDADGVVWSARWGAACIDAYSPDGRRVRTLRLPARQPSCPTFAGPKLDRLLVTSAFEGMDVEAKRADPHHGLTFLVDVGVVGLLEPSYRMSQ